MSDATDTPVLSDCSSAGSDSSQSTPPPSSPSSEKDFEWTLPQPFYPYSLFEDGDKLTEQAFAARKEWKELPPVPKEPQVTEIHEIDKKTPDNWVPRDGRLVRLTGAHPFNCEARINELVDAGFITPSNLFYVRNHGAVPKIDAEKAANWTLRIHGLVEKEQTFDFRSLLTQFETVTLPVTLVCAGNRRKEQNVVAKSRGFSWGAGGLSTALFTGVYLADLLEACVPLKKAKHCIFEGVDNLPNGKYGTSQKLAWARDKGKGMLIAWAMNGLPLEPDHGYPLRVVIPGQIGGRSVKWLDRIEISDKESQHYLHFWDNKVLPTQLTADQAGKEEHWWYDPKYIITELNTNSAIAYPNHDERLAVPEDREETYTIRGYAYAGGGRRVQRVELSFDEGNKWSLAEIQYPEDLYRTVCDSDPVYGRLDMTDIETCFCWCFWTYKIPISALKESPCISVRCQDESLALQPRDMYWNPTGMMNNWWFRIVIHQEKNGNELRFEHPTMAGTVPGGWMQRIKDEGFDPLKPSFAKAGEASMGTRPKVPPPAEVSMINASVKRKITMKEVEEHNAASEPWFVVKGEVYDGTAFLDKHPGGPESITLVAGEDATDDFMAIHSMAAKGQMAGFHIGTLDTSSSDTGKASTGQASANDAEFLHPKVWKPTKLIKIEQVSSDTKLLRFSLDREDQPFGLPTGQHVFMRLRSKIKDRDVVQGELLQRAYTPVSYKSVGYVDFLIKIYFPTAEFPDGGKMTVAIDALAEGDSVELKGPLGSFVHLGKSMIRWRGKERKIKQVGLVSGGTGITPIMQVLQGVFADQEDQETECHVLNCNRRECDILMRSDLDSLQEQHGHTGRLRMHNTLTAPPDEWQYGRGRINVEALRDHLPAPGPENLVCLCGPEPMQETVKKGLTELGWDLSTQLVVF